jgi:hypothetical protein
LTTLVRAFTLPPLTKSCAVKERTLAKKRQTSRSRNQTATTRRRSASAARRDRKRLGINLEPILGVLSAGIARLERQLPAFADDRRRTKALQRSIVRLRSVREKTQAICPSEVLWFGVPVRDGKRYSE